MKKETTLTIYFFVSLIIMGAIGYVARLQTSGQNMDDLINTLIKTQPLFLVYLFILFLTIGFIVLLTLDKRIQPK